MTHLKWRHVWRFGLAPSISSPGLASLEVALYGDDPRLLQGVTCSPPMAVVFGNRTACAACALGWTGWQGDRLRTIGEVADYFHQLCDAADDALREPGACRFFLNWYDETPREVMRRELLAEVRRELTRRRSIAA